MLKKIILVLIFVFPFIANAQNAPLTTIGSVESATPGSIQVPVTVTNFNNIGAIYLSIDYDYSVIQLTGATPHPQLPTFLHGDADLGTGFHRITTGWYGNGLSLPDGSAIMTFSFNYISGNTALTFFENGPSCEYADGDGNVLNDIPSADYYFNGQVCGLLGSTGAISGDNILCQGRQDVVYSILPVPNATVYTWSVPAGATIVCGQSTNLVLVNFDDNAISGTIQVYAGNPCGNGTSSQLSVTVDPLPVANAGNDFSIPYGTSTILHASPGGSGSFSYHWSPEELLVNPDVQDPVTFNLTSTTIFTLLVTNQATLCGNSDEVFVGITGGPLNINPTAVPGSSCSGGSVVLYALASGGTGNYLYSWTSDPPGWTSDLANPVVSPDTTTEYQLMVDDGNIVITGTVGIQVFDLPIATISGSDTLCGSEARAEITIGLAGVPPWNFIYTYGSISVNVSGQETTPYTFNTGEPGNYTISFIKDAHCEGISIGSALISLFPVPLAPVISLIETTLVSDACCGNQWYRDDSAIPGATGVSYTVSESGKYYDIVTRFSCVSDTSNVINVIIDGIGEAVWQGIELYPNPATEFIHGRLSMDSLSAYWRNGRLNRDFTVDIFDIYGRKLRESIVTAGTAEFNVDVSSLSPGLYIIVIRTETASFARKFVVRR
jgi:hypothetical protein